MFVEDYDINVGRHLVQGVDVWLNNPRRPLEACGTSGQKVVLNGGLNCSVLDGWWAEAYDGLNGFAIGGGETHSSPSSPRRARRARRSCRVLARGGDPALLRPRPRRPAARMDRADEARHSHAGLALQRRPDGDGLRDQRLHPGRGRDEQRIARVVRAKSSSLLRGDGTIRRPRPSNCRAGILAGDRLE